MIEVKLPKTPNFLINSADQLPSKVPAPVLVPDNKEVILPIIEEDGPPEFEFDSDIFSESEKREKNHQHFHFDPFINWKSVLSSGLRHPEESKGELHWGQLNNMLSKDASETQWSLLCFGTRYLSPSLTSYGYFFLRNLIQSGQWHGPRKARITYYLWNHLPVIKIQWKRTELPPLFFQEVDGFEVLVEESSELETIIILETKHSLKQGKKYE